MNVLLFHPEGNVNYNVNLSAILRMLTDAGHCVTYVAARRPNLNQVSPSSSVRVLLFEEETLHRPILAAKLTPDDFKAFGGHDFVIGVDRGVIDAAEAALHYRCQHALFSYEIMFESETSAEFKLPEILACRDIAFAVCQDAVRLAKLCRENAIPPEKVLQIPAAGFRFKHQDPKPRLLHEALSLAPEIKIVLHLGSFAEWTHASYLLNSTHCWPEDWMLVIHQRYGPAAGMEELIHQKANPARLRLSRQNFASCGDMTSFIQSADLGVALYHPTYENRWVGRNIKYIGLSSGKIASYLQHGVPVATHPELGEIADWIQFYNAGQVFSLKKPFIPHISSHRTVEGTRQLFEEHLDLARFADLLLDALQQSALGRPFDRRPGWSPPRLQEK